ncbi:hypothetical protein, partial [Rubrivirga sp.]|uniref:hypothetical protein n=1 Tax=Rubrivirga sp. TaxID=1885344 RepID=UPI003C73BBB3
VDVRLSNLIRLAETPDPAFVAVVELADGRPSRAFVVHIDGALVRRVLERRWRVENTPGKALHRSRMSVPYGTDHELNALTGSALLGSLDVAPAGPAYARWKSALLEEAGFEEGPMVAGLFVSGSDAAVRLAEVEIGLAPSAPIGGFRLRPLRFGLLGAEPVADIPAGEFSLADLPEPSDVTVTVSAPDLGRRISVPGRLRVPHLFGPTVAETLGHDRVPFRVETDVFELRARGPHAEVSFWMASADERAPLRRVRDALETVRLLAEAAQGGHDVDLAVTRDDGVVFHFRPDLRPDHPPCGWVVPQAFVRLDLAWGLARAFEIEDTVEISPTELFGDPDASVMLAAMMGTAGAPSLKGPDPEVTFRLRGPEAHIPGHGDSPFVLGYGAVFGDHQLVALLRLDGPIVQTHAAEGEGDYRVPFSRTEAVYARAYAEGEAVPTSDVLAQVATNRVGSRTICVIPPFGALGVSSE